jgi:TonB family protein
MRSLCLPILCFISVSLVWSQAGGSEANALLKQGDEAMMQRKWHDAEAAFRKAVEADPTAVEAHSKLSNALALQMRPGPATSSENRPLLAQVLAEQQRAADLAPQNAQVLSQLAHIQDAVARSSQDPDEQSRSRNLAIENARRAIQLAPNDPNLRFQLANMELFAVGSAIWEARRRAQDQTPGFRVRDSVLRQNLSWQYGATLNEIIAQSERAVQLQPDNSFSMLQTVLGYSFRAGLADSDAESARDMSLANQWQARFRTQWGQNFSPELERNILGGLLNPRVVIATDPMAGGVIGGILGGVSGAPPPPPPPPKLGAFSGNGPVRVGGGVAEANLIKRVPPAYPPVAKAARVQGSVEFTAIIDKNGHVREVQLVRGHPLLVNAAKEAVLQWEYRPTMLNGKLVEVITSIVINFTLSGMSPSDSPPTAGTDNKPPDATPPKSN